MVILNEEQVGLVIQKLEAEGLDYEPLQEELADHICCSIEQEMARGASFSDAIGRAFADFHEGEIPRIQRQTIRIVHQKPRYMKMLSLLALGLMLALPTANWLSQQEPPSLHPLGKEYTITSGFGMRTHPIAKTKRMHKGMDFRAPVGTPVLATASGIVEVTAYKKDSYGHHILIDHGEGYESLYSQLSEIKVEKGQQVEKGQVIGLTGNSGLSTGPHLHYEVRQNGENLDPAGFIKE